MVLDKTSALILIQMVSKLTSVLTLNILVLLRRNRHFHQTNKHNVEQASMAMYVLFKRICNLDFPIDMQLYLFDHVILPIAFYGCKIWGFENSQIIENLHNDFLRQIINLRKSTPIYMLHEE